MTQEDRPALEYQRDFDACESHAPAPDVRLVNAQTGREHPYCAWCLSVVAEPMPARDALADAETLQWCHNAYNGLTECWRAPYPPMLGFSCCDLAEARAWGEICAVIRSNGNDWSGQAEEAARAAFRAVPGLRGEGGA